MTSAEPKKKLSLGLRILQLCVGTLLVMTLVAAGCYAWGVKYYNNPGPLTAPAIVYIPKGTGFRQSVQLLAQGGAVEYPFAFEVITVLLGKNKQMKAGEYEFPAGASPMAVTDALISGKTVVHKLTIPEGLTTTQILEMVNTESALAGDLPAGITEGELLPETYYFSRNDERNAIVLRMRDGMRTFLIEQWAKRRLDLPLRNPQEALVLASIVEKETGIDNEYGKVASVYVNRLRKNMLLQADPTVIYAITKGKQSLGRSLKYSDLRMQDSYNTYVMLGLPPGPIANPGRKAIEAVMNPPETDYIFFVANGRGGHNFAVGLKEHNANVAKFRELLDSVKK